MCANMFCLKAFCFFPTRIEAVGTVVAGGRNEGMFQPAESMLPPMDGIYNA